MFSSKPMVWFATALICGILAGWMEISFFPLAGFLLVFSVIILAYLYSMSRKEELSTCNSPLNPYKPPWVKAGRERMLLSAGLVVMLLGAARYSDIEAARQQNLKRLPEFSDVRIRVSAPPESAIVGEVIGQWSCSGELTFSGDDGLSPVSIMVYGYGDRSFRRGDILVGRIRKHNIPRPDYPGAFDLSRYLRSLGHVCSVSFVKNPDREKSGDKTDKWKYRIIDDDGFVPARYLDYIRSDAIRTVLSVLPENEGSLLAVAMFGYQISRGDANYEDFLEVKRSFRNIGIGHLLAISGLHVGLVVGLTWFCLSIFVYDKRKLAVCCIAVCLLYLCLSGARVAAVRASIMALVYLCGFVLARRGDFLNSLGLAAIIILMMNPFSLFDLGFQLSFVAVIFIGRLCAIFVEVVEGIQPVVEKPQKPEVDKKFRGQAGLLLRRLYSLATLSVSAWAGVWPLSAYAFYQVVPVGLLINIIVLPLMSLVLASGVAIQCLAKLFALNPDSYAVAVCGVPAQSLLILADLVDRSSWGTFHVARPGVEWLVLYYAAFVGIFLKRFLPAGWPRMGWIVVMVVAIAGSSLCIVNGRCGMGKNEIIFLPGREGETAIVRSVSGKVLVIGDLERDGAEAGRFLRSVGVGKVDIAVPYAKGDNIDDNVGGLKAFVDLSEVEALSGLCEPAKKANGGWVSLTDGVSLYFSIERSGKVVWWGIQCGKLSAGVSRQAWPQQIEYRFEHDFPATSSELLLLGVKGRKSPKLPSLSSGWIFANNNAVGDGINDRKSCGAIKYHVDKSGRSRLYVYRDYRWAEIPSDDKVIVGSVK